jgi:hypothetical protein
VVVDVEPVSRFPRLNGIRPRRTST